MTTTSADPTPTFSDALRMKDASIERLAAGDIRDAAEKAWCATVRATEALVLARTGQPPGASTAAGRRLRALSVEDPSAESLARLYSYRQDVLHGECFYHDYCQPVVTERLIHQTADYLREAQTLAHP